MGVGTDQSFPVIVHCLFSNAQSGPAYGECLYYFLNHQNNICFLQIPNSKISAFKEQDLGIPRMLCSKVDGIFLLLYEELQTTSGNGESENQYSPDERLPSPMWSVIKAYTKKNHH